MKGHGTYNAILFVTQTLQSVLETGREARIVQIDFSAVFDRVSHEGILLRLCSVGVGGSVLSVLTQFLSNRSQYMVADGYKSKLVNFVSGVPYVFHAVQHYFGSAVVPPFHSEAFLHRGEQALRLC